MDQTCLVEIIIIIISVFFCEHVFFKLGNKESLKYYVVRKTETWNKVIGEQIPKSMKKIKAKKEKRKEIRKKERIKLI